MRRTNQTPPSELERRLEPYRATRVPGRRELTVDLASAELELALRAAREDSGHPGRL